MSTSGEIQLSTGLKGQPVIVELAWDTGASVNVGVSGPCNFSGSGGFKGGASDPVIFPGDTCVFTVSAPETADRAATTAKLILVATSAGTTTWTVDGPLSGCFSTPADKPTLPDLTISTDSRSAAFSLRFKSTQSIIKATSAADAGRKWTFSVIGTPAGQKVTFTISFGNTGDLIVDTIRSVDVTWQIGGC